MSAGYYQAGYAKSNAVADGALNWDLGLERMTAGTGVIGTDADTTAITIGRSGITTTFPGVVKIGSTGTINTGTTLQIGDGTDASSSSNPYLYVNGTGSSTQIAIRDSTADVEMALICYTQAAIIVRTAHDLEFWTNGTERASYDSIGSYVQLQGDASSGSRTAVTVTSGTHTSQAASTEAVSVNYNLSATVQFATGALTTQRAFLIQAPTYAFVGNSTLTNATTFDITAAPTAGTSATVTNTRIVRLGGNVTIGATAASMTYSGIDIPAHTITVTGSTQVTSASAVAAIRLGIPTITDASAVTVDAAATLYIAGAVAAAGSVTLTRGYSIHVDAGECRFDGDVILSDGTTTTATSRMNIIHDSASQQGLRITDTSGKIWAIAGGIVSASAFTIWNQTDGRPACTLSAVPTVDSVYNEAGVDINLRYEGGAGGAAVSNNLFTIDAGLDRVGVGVALAAHVAMFEVIDKVRTSGSPQLLRVEMGAHTTLAASAEATSINFDLDATKQFAQGALTTQREVLISAGTIGFATGSSTLTNATVFDITAALTAGTNAVFTNSRVVRLAGDVTIGATSAGMTYSVIDIPAHTVTVSGSTQVTSAAMGAAVRLGIITLTDGDAVTIDAAATLYIAGAPAQAGSVTLSAAYSLWIDAGNFRCDGVILNSLGSVSAVPYSFNGDPNTGMYSSGADIVGMVAGGAEIANFQKATTGGGWMTMDEADSDPGTGVLDAGDAVAVYNKSNKIVFAYNLAGTINYLSCALDGSTVTWVNSSSAP